MGDIRKGHVVVVVDQVGKACPPVGTKGVVFWAGFTKYGQERVGFNVAGMEDPCWATQEALERVGGAEVAQVKKAGLGPSLYRALALEKSSSKALLCGGTWWPRSQAHYKDGWLQVTEWLLNQKFADIPAGWISRADMEAITASLEVPPELAAVATAGALVDEYMNADPVIAINEEPTVSPREPVWADHGIEDVLCDLFAD